MKRLLFIPLLLLCACHYVSERDFDMIQVGMSKEQVRRAMGSGGVSRGSKINKKGKPVEIKEYQTRKFIWGQGRVIRTYWAYFHDGKLVQWGRPDDWRAEGLTYDININRPGAR